MGKIETLAQYDANDMLIAQKSPLQINAGGCPLEKLNKLFYQLIQVQDGRTKAMLPYPMSGIFKLRMLANRNEHA